MARCFTDSQGCNLFGMETCAVTEPRITLLPVLPTWLSAEHLVLWTGAGCYWPRTLLREDASTHDAGLGNHFITRIHTRAPPGYIN